MPIYLVGFMGAGKSYTGRRLADRLGHRFVDLDATIEAAAGTSIATYFAEHGEAAFRRLEAEHLRHLDAAETVVATGGGAPCFHEGMDYIRTHGLAVFLDPSEDILLDRLQGGVEHRPLLASTSELQDLIRQKMAERRPTYERAQLHLAYDDPDIDVPNEIVRWLEKFGPAY